MEARKRFNRSEADKWPIWLPTPGNIAFTLVAIGILFWANSAGAVRLLSSTTDEPALTNTSSSTISYQGYLADSGGNPVNATVDMVFNLYSVESGGTAVWSEFQTVTINDGLFSVLLGSQTPLSTNLFAVNNNLWLGITVGTDGEMTPREKIASAPFAILANVADGSITQSKLASSAVTTNALANAAVTSDKLANSAVTTARIANNAVTSDKLAGGSVAQVHAPSLVRSTNGNLRKIQYGKGTISASFCSGTAYYCADITLSESFANTNYSIVVTGAHRFDLRVVSRTTTSFRVRSDQPGYHEFDWIAIGN